MQYLGVNEVARSSFALLQHFEFGATDGQLPQPPAAPSRGSRVPGDSCSRSIFCGRREAPLRSATPREFGREECATWVNVAAYGQLPQPPAFPSRGSRVPGDSCSRSIFCGRWEAPLRSATRREFGREECATWVNAAAYGQLPQPPAAPSRGSHVPGDSCSRSIFCGRWEASLRSRCSLRHPSGVVLRAVSARRVASYVWP